jgi:hypothetical protein
VSRDDPGRLGKMIDFLGKIYDGAFGKIGDYIATGIFVISITLIKKIINKMKPTTSKLILKIVQIAFIILSVTFLIVGNCRNRNIINNQKTEIIKLHNKYNVLKSTDSLFIIKTKDSLENEIIKYKNSSLQTSKTDKAINKGKVTISSSIFMGPHAGVGFIGKNGEALNEGEVTYDHNNFFGPMVAVGSIVKNKDKIIIPNNIIDSIIILISTNKNISIFFIKDNKESENVALYLRTKLINIGYINTHGPYFLDSYKLNTKLDDNIHLFIDKKDSNNNCIIVVPRR